MKQNNKKNILFRYFLIIGAIFIVVLAIVSHMVYNTIIVADHWNEKANKITALEIPIQPERGNIYASNGTLLATSLNFYIARLDFRCNGFNEKAFINAMPALCDSLAKIFPAKSAEQWKESFKKELNRKPRTRSFKVANDLYYKEYLRLKKLPFLKERKNKAFLYPEIITKRIKPYGKMATLCIGEVNTVDIERKADPNNPGEKKVIQEVHGATGLEASLDSLLYGIPGIAHKVQVTNNLVNWETKAAVKGYDIKTTIDIEIQDILESELSNMCQNTGSEWGTAIIMDVATGDIKAISNITHDKRTDTYIEGWLNRAVMGFEPGSVMKPISMMMALEDGIVNNVDEIITTGTSFAYAGGSPIRDSHGMACMPVRRVIESSSNIGMSKIILRKYEKHPGQYRERLEQMGFFDKFNIGIKGERVPRIAKLGDKNWDRISLTRMSYGYSTQIPPLYTLAMYNAMANDGKFVRPRLVKELMRDGVTDSIIPVSYIRKQVCSPTNAEKLRNMLHDVVWGEYGTAKVLRNDTVEICGKTGTCFDIDTTTHRYNPALKRLAFCGFFPFKKPKYSCIVLMSHANCGAARCCGMVLKNVALKLYARGMLDNSSNYKEDKIAAANKQNGILFAMDKNKANAFKESFAISNLNLYKYPNIYTNDKVPSVIGLGLRDAVAILEDRGLNVKFRGSGMVTGQSIQAGTPIKKGETIIISLKN